MGSQIWQTLCRYLRHYADEWRMLQALLLRHDHD